MARTHTAELMLQGQALSSLGATSCPSGFSLNHEKPVRRMPAIDGSAVVRW
jgi:hypothetical protein